MRLGIGEKQWGGEAQALTRTVGHRAACMPGPACLGCLARRLREGMEAPGPKSHGLAEYYKTNWAKI